jgi:MYXO-CTERM domain-containing protein
MRRTISALVLAATASSWPRPAGAFCRTTTAPIPADYNPVVEGCITQGTPLAWQSMPVTYELDVGASKNVSLDEATLIFDAAFAAWAAVSCPASGPDGGSPAGAARHPALSFERLAPTDAAFVQCEAGAEACEKAQSVGPHQIVFRDGGWPYMDSANQIALTTVTFGVDDGRLLSANMEINSKDYTLSTVDPPPDGGVSLTAIARHEAGHFIGLAHAQTTSPVMYAYYQPGAIALTQDDIDGVCAIYPPAAHTSGCACSTDGRAGVAIPWGMAAIVVAVAAARRRKRSAPSTAPASTPARTARRTSMQCCKMRRWMTPRSSGAASQHGSSAS